MAQPFEQDVNGISLWSVEDIQQRQRQVEESTRIQEIEDDDRNDGGGGGGGGGGDSRMQVDEDYFAGLEDSAILEVARGGGTNSGRGRGGGPGLVPPV